MSTVESTRTVTLNAAFLQEIKEVNQELWETLAKVRRLCGELGELRGRVSILVESLAALRDQLAFHFSLEEAYGYFEDPVAVAPQLCRRAADLRAEHRDLYQSICRLAEHAEDVWRRGPTSSAMQQVSREFNRFDQRLQKHETRENALIWEEYDGDIGVGD